MLQSGLFLSDQQQLEFCFYVYTVYTSLFLELPFDGQEWSMRNFEEFIYFLTALVSVLASTLNVYHHFNHLHLQCSKKMMM